MAGEILTNKKKMFVKEYLVDLNATKAAIRAGYSPKTAQEQASRLLATPLISGLVQKAMDERSKRTEITADAVLEELAKLGFSNIKNVYNEKTGELAEVISLDDKVTASITEVVHTVRRDKDGNTTTERKYKVADKKGSLELLGKHLKLFTDKVDISNPDGTLRPEVINIVGKK